MKPRIVTIAQKEFFHIIRDPRTLSIIFIMPVLQLLIFGYALKTELQDVSMAVIDYDNSTQSKQLKDLFSENNFFKVKTIDRKEIDTSFKKREIDATLIIPSRFAESLKKGVETELQLIIDASNQNNAKFVQNYSANIVNRFKAQLNPKRKLSFEIKTRKWYNPEGKSSYFIVPGILAIILIMICALLTSIAIAREKETGTMEQLLVSAIHPTEIILGKVIPYTLLGILDSILIVLVSIIVFNVPFIGSVWLLGGLTFIYILSALSLGLLISTVASSQQNAMMLALSTTMLPSMFLSGFFFPLESMPKILRIFSHLIPARYYLKIVRGIMLKGNSFDDLLKPTIILAVISLLMLAVAVRKFNQRLD